jgi:hypothetical protein
MPPIAGIGVELFIATQALAVGGGTHRQAQNAPPPPHSETPHGKKIHPCAPSKKNGKKMQEEEFC